MGGGDNKPGHLLCILPFPEPKEIIDRIKASHPNLKVTYVHPQTHEFTNSNQGIPDDLWQDATVLVTLAALPSSPDKAPKLEFVQFISAGTNHVEKHPIYTDTKIPLATSSGIHGPSISEWVLMTMLASSHYYNMLHDWQSSHQWLGSQTGLNARLQSVRDAVGMRLGVLGYGSIGRQVARVCKAMGMDVIAYTASPRSTPESKKDHGFIVPGTGDPEGEFPSAWYSGLAKSDIHNFLRQDIDVLVISVPLTKDTYNFIGKEEFDILAKRNAFVSNISRGQIIDQEELIRQLEAFESDSSAVQGQGRRGLRGAALDVTDPEPLPEGHPLWSAPNCIVTPHISALGEAYVGRALQVLDINLGHWEKGEKLINVVDRRRGY